MAKPRSNVEKRLEGGGPETPKLNMKQFIELADAEKIQSDLEGDIIQLLNEKFLDQKKPGESFSDWLKRTPREELLKLELSNGGKVIMLSDYLKQKEKPRIKTIDLAQGDFEKTVAGLTSSDKAMIKDLLRKSGIKVSD
jgi:hypothetical protein|tara:strand:+ start:381 stop:797 length:417 start_codon:yes stop_codon:yes gene_type:complete